jgi:hypothetical protein
MNDGIFDPQLEFSVTKCGSICMDVLIPKTTDTGHLWIQDLFMKLHCVIQK